MPESKSDLPKVSTATRRKALRVYQQLEEIYPHAHCALEHRNAYELLVATILSAQCTDDRVNMTTPSLFAKYPTVQALAKAKQADIEKIIKSCGFYRNKAKNIIGAAAAIVEKHGGQVPKTMDELLALPGVARKTANVVLGNAYGINEGVVVDTHVGRLAVRFGFTDADQKNAPRIERDLMALFPRENWTMLSHLLIWHGRAYCKARNPDIKGCPMGKQCCKGQPI